MTSSSRAFGSTGRGVPVISDSMTRAPGVLRRSWDSDLAYSFRNSPYAIVAALVFLLCVGSSVFAPWVAPHNPFDLGQLDLSN